MNYKNKIFLSIISIFSFTLFFIGENISFGESAYSQNESRERGSISQKEEKNLDDNTDFELWKKNIDIAEKKIKDSRTLKTFGIIAVGGGVVFILLSEGKKGGGSISSPVGTPRQLAWGVSLPPISYTKWEFAVPGLILCTTGLVLSIVGKTNGKKAAKQKKTLEEEGKAKGYFKVNINPVDKSAYFSYLLKF